MRKLILFSLLFSLNVSAETSFKYSKDSLHQWACTTVIDFGKKQSIKGYTAKDVWGCYDWCDGNQGDFKHIDKITDACAIIVNGAEW